MAKSIRNKFTASYVVLDRNREKISKPLLWKLSVWCVKRLYGLALKHKIFSVPLPLSTPLQIPRFKSSFKLQCQRPFGSPGKRVGDVNHPKSDHRRRNGQSLLQSSTHLGTSKRRLPKLRCLQVKTKTQCFQCGRPDLLAAECTILTGNASLGQRGQDKEWNTMKSPSYL